jgi:hypothetical protein
MEGVELADFIKNTLIDIASGIKGANDELKDSKSGHREFFMLRSNRGDSAKIPGITFDVAVTATKNQKDKAGFMVALASIGGGAGTEKGFGGETAHRIKFEVGIYSGRGSALQTSRCGASGTASL